MSSSSSVNALRKRNTAVWFDSILKLNADVKPSLKWATGLAHRLRKTLHLDSVTFHRGIVSWKNYPAKWCDNTKQQQDQNPFNYIYVEATGLFDMLMHHKQDLKQTSKCAHVAKSSVHLCFHLLCNLLWVCKSMMDTASNTLPQTPFSEREKKKWKNWNDTHS